MGFDKGMYKAQQVRDVAAYIKREKQKKKEKNLNKVFFCVKYILKLRDLG